MSVAVAVAFRPSSKVKDDRYFILPTPARVVAEFYKRVIRENNIEVTRIEDPCAGKGEMARHFNCTSYDKTPEPNDFGVTVLQRDFMLHHQDHEVGLMLVMNVPYGYYSQGALAFINHGATFADVLCVVVPSTWAREHNTVTQHVDKYFHLVDQMLLPTHSFYAPDNNDAKHDVPSVAQVWVRKQDPRVDAPRIRRSQWFTARQNKGTALATTPDLAIRRVGNVGEIVTSNFDNLTPETWWFIDIIQDKRRVKRAFKNIDWSGLIDRMGPQSINKAELFAKVDNWLSTNQ